MSAAYATRADDDFAARSDEEEQYDLDEYDSESADEEQTTQTSNKQSARNSGDEEEKTADAERTFPLTAIPISPQPADSRLTARPAFSSTAPLSAPPSRPLSVQSRSQLLTSAISDEEQSDSDNSSDGQDESEKRAAATQRMQPTPAPTRPHTADNTVPKARLSTTSTSANRPGTAAATRRHYEPSPLALRLEASGSIQAIAPLSGQEWRARLQQIKARIVKEGYSRGERVGAGEEEKQQLDLPADARPSLTSLDQAGFARAALLSQQQAASSRSGVDSSATLPSPHTSLALKWNAYATDREGMVQELQTLRRDKRRLLATIDAHTQQLAATQHGHERLLAMLTALARQKGRVIVTAADGRARAEAAGEVGEAGAERLNPLLSPQQAAVALSRELIRLQADKERRECEQDDIEEQQRLDEERAAEDEKSERRYSRRDDEYSDDDEQRPRLTQRHRLRVLREKKAALLEKVHALQEQLQQRGAVDELSGRDQATVDALVASIATARTHADTYEEQLVQRQRQLERVRDENERLVQQAHDAAFASHAKASKHRSRA